MSNDEDAAISFDEAVSILLSHYRMHARLNSLPGERDRNFLVESEGGERFVLKISGPSEPRAVSDLQLHVHRWLVLSNCGLILPRLQPTLQNEDHVVYRDTRGRSRICRLLSYVSGQPLRAPSYSAAQRISAGEASGKLTIALNGFEHEAANRDIIWDIVQGHRMEALLQYLPKDSKNVAGGLIARFRTDIAEQVSLLPHQVVHNDLNAGNLMTSAADTSIVIGVIDFGDILRTATIVDAAVGAASLLTAECSLYESLSEYLSGYERYRRITPQEFATFPLFVAMRLLMQMVVPAWYRERNPNNPHYHNFDTKVGVRTEWIGQLLELTGTRLKA